MIITVTMNPAIDKTADVDNLRIGELNRVKNIIQDAGGKGINVSRTIHALGGDTIATGFLGGDAGKMIGLSLTQLNIKHDFVFIEGETRTNTKIIDKSNGNLVTELNEPGPDILPSELEQLCEKLEGYASPDNIFVFSGSIPNKISPSIYGQLIRKLKKKRAKVFVDADGELLAEAIKAKPFIVKPNRLELKKYLGIDEDIDDAMLLEKGKSIINNGPKIAVISCGSRGAYFINGDTVYYSPGIEVHTNSTVGAGDAMIGALAYGLDNNLSFEESCKLSIAASAGACTTIGTKPPTKELVEMLVNDVNLIKIK
ncbi:MAG: 1-phosphofructokinase [Lachnospiraceae bacterium]|nr:1-phosphofructokinase [Lachnospiraceae bacterium]